MTETQDLDRAPDPVDPTTVPQLVRVYCGAQPPHDPLWAEYDDEAWYAPSCPMCSYRLLDDAHAGCAHSHHRAWRRWKITGRVASWAYSVGLIAGYGHSSSEHCRGCIDGFVFRPRSARSYVLGWPAWKWGCLFKGRHWPGQFVGLGCCTKCLPCPECGSTAPDHDVFHQEG